jgi:hypothetical protein
MSNVTKPALALAGLALAAGSVYLFDPDNGKRRRAVAGEKCRSTFKKLDEGSHTLRDELTHRYKDAASRARSWFNSGDRSDAALARHVRLDLWRAIENSRRIGVVVHEGDVILHGDVVAADHERVLQIVRSVEGVGKVTDLLSERATADPQMKDWGVRRGYTLVQESLSQEHWTPPTRVVSSVAGLSLMGWGVSHRDVFGVLGALLGAAMVVRSATNVPFRRWVGGTRDAIDDMTDAAVEQLPHGGNNLGSSKDWRRPDTGSP